jgi:hypothetical protein
MLYKTSTRHAPWFVIPSNCKWFRNLAVTQIISRTLDDLRLKVPNPKVDIADIRRRYHAAEDAAKQHQRLRLGPTNGFKSPYYIWE